MKCMCLCEGRHSIPEAVDGAIFSNTIDPLDLASMRSVAAEKLEGVEVLHLYVTGLTVALVEVINLCHERSIELTLYHYDRESGTYYPQAVR